MKTSTSLINSLNDYMFTVDNLSKYTKHIISINLVPTASNKNIGKPTYDSSISFNSNKQIVESIPKQIVESIPKQIVESIPKQIVESIPKQIVESKKNNLKERFSEYKPKQKDSLFWCFYILKNGFLNYEMEIHNQYFIVEKKEKFKYIELLRQNKELLKIHKIKPFTELEDDLANKERISVKTFFALCILENINVLLVDKRKIFELTCIDISSENPVNIVHRNRKNYEHYIETEVTDNILNNYRNNYYNSELDETLKSIGSYKLSELIELCNKLDINITLNEGEKKKTKKDIYELLVLNY
jgi:hypothetical protein